MSELPRLLTAENVADWLGLTVRQINRLAKQQKIPSIVLPTGDLVFDPEALTAWLETTRSGKGETVHA
jgi:hypothetical protein